MLRTALIVLTTMTCLSSAEDAVPDLTGLWVGEYAQVQEEGTLRVPFTMVVTQQYRTILARSLEVQTFGTSVSAGLSADIKGVMDGDKLHLVKTYDGSGGQTHSVNYSLTLSADRKQLEGEWVLSNEVRGPVKVTWRARATLPGAESPPSGEAARKPPVPGFTLSALAAEVGVMKALLQAKKKEKVVEFLKRYFEPAEVAEAVKEAGSYEVVAELVMQHGKDKDLLATLNALDFKRPPVESVAARSQAPEPNRAIIDEAERTITFIQEAEVIPGAPFEIEGRPIRFKFVDGRWYVKE